MTFVPRVAFGLAQCAVDAVAQDHFKRLQGCVQAFGQTGVVTVQGNRSIAIARRPAQVGDDQSSKIDSCPDLEAWANSDCSYALKKIFLSSSLCRECFAMWEFAGGTVLENSRNGRSSMHISAINALKSFS